MVRNNEYEAMYSKIDHVKTVDSLETAHIVSKFLKTVFHKLYLAHARIHLSICSYHKHINYETRVS